MTWIYISIGVTILSAGFVFWLMHSHRIKRQAMHDDINRIIKQNIEAHNRSIESLREERKKEIQSSLERLATKDQEIEKRNKLNRHLEGQVEKYRIGFLRSIWVIDNSSIDKVFSTFAKTGHLNLLCDEDRIRYCKQLKIKDDKAPV